MTDRDTELFDLSTRIGEQVKYHKRAAGSFSPSFLTTSLWGLTIETLRRVEESLNKEHGHHVAQLIDTNSDAYSGDDAIIVEFIDLIPRLTEDQQAVTVQYFSALRRWHHGSALCLDLMGYFGAKYLQATGVKNLPCTSEEDQKLFLIVAANPHLRDALSMLVSRTDEITPALINSIMETHPALIDGAL